MRTKKFLRRNTNEYLRLGKLRPKLQKWRKPKGRDNKMRLKVKGRPRVVEIGYKNSEDDRGKVNNKIPILISNISDLDKVGKDNIAILGRFGTKKKMEIAKIAHSKNIHFANFNVKKMIKLSENNKEKKQ